tara:strand:+ start:965 stop:1174 length:210 start_codon:yes stop_codon:yes gene_type:complete
MIFNYESKKQMKECIGQPLRYTETSFFGEEYKSDGSFIGCNRPTLPEGTGTREFFAKVTMEDGKIKEVE